MGIEQIIIGAVLVEHLLEGFHRNPWTVQFKTWLMAKTKEGSKLREYLSCKFCESWALGWIVALSIGLWYTQTWAWDWLWAGVIMSSLANATHGIKDWLAVVKFGPIGGETIVMKKGK
jgi:hypothetical protein